MHLNIRYTTPVKIFSFDSITSKIDFLELHFQIYKDKLREASTIQSLAIINKPNNILGYQNVPTEDTVN